MRLLRFRERLHARLRGGSDAGLSLVEVIVAITILAVVSLMAAQLLSGAIRATSSVDRMQTAVAVATLQMESVRGAEAGPDPAGTSVLFTGRPRSQQLAAFNTSTNSAAASVADILANTYPEWDTQVPADSQFAYANAIVPPSGIESDIETDGATVVYRDATGTRVYPLPGHDSFGSSLWSLSSGGAPIQTVWTASGNVNGAGIPEYVAAGLPSLYTTVTPTNVAGVPTIYQSTVAGYPNGQVTLNGTTFSTTVLIGSCYMRLDAAEHLKGQCKKIAGIEAGADQSDCDAAAPAAWNCPAVPQTVNGYAKLIRVIVVVEWAAGCSATDPCSYALTSEFLPNIKDLKWRV